MKVNLLAPVVLFDGTPVTSSEGPTTLKNIAVQSLMGDAQDVAQETTEVRIKRGELGLRLFRETESETELSAEDIVLIKQRIGKFFSTPVMLASFSLLEGQS